MWSDLDIEQAVLQGEQRFTLIGCAECYIPQLPLQNASWIFTEPSPYNPAGTLKPTLATETRAKALQVDLTSDLLLQPRLKPDGRQVLAPAYTDLKLHDVTVGPNDPNAEPIDMIRSFGSAEFFVGNRHFLTPPL